MVDFSSLINGGAFFGIGTLGQVGRESDESYASLIDDAVGAYDDVRTMRFHATIKDIGSPQEVAQYIYLFENANGNRSHAVIPLFQMRKGVQFNMDVRDRGDKKLVYLDSKFCRRAAQSYAANLHREIDSYFRAYGKSHGLKLSDVEAAIPPPLFDEKAKAEHAAALQRALNHVAAILHEIPRDYLRVGQEKGAVFDALPPDARRLAEEYAALHSASSKLASFLKLHEDHYIPLVLIGDPLKPHGDAEGKHLALVKHAVQGAHVEESTATPTAKTWTGKIALAVAKVVAYPFILILAGVIGFLWLIMNACGFDRHETSAPLNTKAESSHFRLAIAEGYSILRVSPQSLPSKLFASHNNEDEWSKQDDRSVYFYRPRMYVQQYVRHLKARATDGREKTTLAFAVWGFEGIGVLALFLFSLAFAWLWNSDLMRQAADPSASAVNLSLLTAAVSLMVAYVLHAKDKPALRGPLVAKLLLFIFVLTHPYWRPWVG